MNVQAYDVEFSVRTKSTGETNAVTKREYAYDVKDALSQAIYNVMASFGPRSTLFELDLVQIGPPREVVEAASRGVVAQIAEVLERLRKTRGKEV